ncbi:CaiB/BaiF CoA transferase family protein [Aciditerrimonas ferrireducens]|uniref:CaiB/BaiF CoA transferase family protein n=1 Tax=Aciditerrimonas ferrireducens TaxID=667306 RepID=UPI0020047256|nr:CaiB/BaiF CoA-transferase family protein [Aciditerrimonas ferrireducens]MCK4177965.1 CoA transferase [Aciditerrimonas ferrireducens]
MSGPLEGIRVVELAGIGPGPYCCMLLADLGAEVLRVERLGRPPGPEPSWDLLLRGRQSVALDLKRPEGVAAVLALVERADVLVEGWRPQVAERLGVGPEACLARNPRLVYGRMTGWGQDGPLAERAGHDIDYIALAGALWPIGRDGDRPVPPLNLVGDFGGGGLLLAFGICAALVERARSGRGQVVDAAMVDGAASLTTMLHGFLQAGLWERERGANLLDSGAPFYEVYETADGRYMAVGAIEPQFYAALLEGLGFDPAELPPQMDRAAWPATKARFAERFSERTQAEWEAVFAGTDACVAPVRAPWEAPADPHLRARGTFVEVAGVTQPGPAPRFSRTPGAVRCPPPQPGADGGQALVAWGLEETTVRQLADAGVLGPSAEEAAGDAGR